jgi:hypothetical protein
MFSASVQKNMKTVLPRIVSIANDVHPKLRCEMTLVTKMEEREDGDVSVEDCILKFFDKKSGKELYHTHGHNVDPDNLGNLLTLMLRADTEPPCHWTGCKGDCNGYDSDHNTPEDDCGCHGGQDGK